MARTHVMLPDELIATLDRVIEKRKRSAFIEAAIRETLRRERQSRVLRETAGVIRASAPPEWTTPAGTSAWVHALRALEEERNASLPDSPDR